MPKALTDEHKAALALGRAQSRAIRRYLDALASQQPKRGRTRTPESIGKRLDEIPSEIEAASPIRAVQLVQERLDLEAELERLIDVGGLNIEELRAGFVQHAKAYSEAKGLTYTAWREIGVSAEDLRAAGIPRGRRG